MQQALSWASSYFDGALTPWTACCCSSSSQPNGKYADVVVLSDWDMGESVPGFIGGIKAPAATNPTHTSRPSSSRTSANAWEVGDELEDPSAAQEALALRELMKKFVQEMVAGKKFDIVIEEGKTELGRLLLSPNLLSLRLEAAGVTHEILLRDIKDVRPGKMGSSFAPIQLDELCDTLVLKNNSCITFRLRSVVERDNFSKCIKVLALALEQ
mmetsp:Transcript_61384/g.99393  ORF Transcript_61384/g.99393 Transcript_61384/m.99393 type:complete len:213 (-) Transcript_61384:231-869(-)